MFHSRRSPSSNFYPMILTEVLCRVGGVRITTFQEADNILVFLAFAWKCRWMKKVAAQLGTVVMGHRLLNRGVCGLRDTWKVRFGWAQTIRSDHAMIMIWRGSFHLLVKSSCTSDRNTSRNMWGSHWRWIEKYSRIWVSLRLRGIRFLPSWDRFRFEPSIFGLGWLPFRVWLPFLASWWRMELAQLECCWRFDGPGSLQQHFYGKNRRSMKK